MNVGKLQYNDIWRNKFAVMSQEEYCLNPQDPNSGPGVPLILVKSDVLGATMICVSHKVLQD